ncbi:hypothetical protein BDV06DRAFT_222543 [Aspergillus oleicola]
MSEEPAVGAQLASRVARVLDAAKIAYELEFVIPDELMEKAIKALEVDGLRRCKDRKCQELCVDRARELYNYRPR